MARKHRLASGLNVEDCYLRFCTISGTNSGATMKNFVVRRNLVVDHYPLRGHTMGVRGRTSARATTYGTTWITSHGTGFRPTSFTPLWLLTGTQT
jgi:hypothetical protein